MDKYFLLIWFEASKDDFVGEERMDVTEDEILKWFYLNDRADIFGSLTVTASQRLHLNPRVKHEINLN